MEDFNLRILLKCEMLGNRHWRAQVLEDLGGETALTRWDKRKAKAEHIILDPHIVPYREVDECETILKAPLERETVTIPGVEAVELKAAHIKTDRDGLFRLAHIPHTVRPLTVQEDFARWEAKAWREAMRPCPKAQTAKSGQPETFKPIPVTPDELRSSFSPPPSEAPEPSDTPSKQIAGHAEQSQSSPCPDPAPLLETRSLFLIPDKRGPP